MDTTIKGVEETTEYKEMNAYNQAIRDVLELMKKIENDVSEETTEQEETPPFEAVSSIVEDIKTELIRLFLVRKTSWEDGHVENKEIASAHAKYWDSAIRIIKGNAIDDVVDRCLNKRQKL